MGIKRLILFLLIATLIFASADGIDKVREKFEKNEHKFEVNEVDSNYVWIDSEVKIYQVLSYETMPPKESFVLERDGEIYDFEEFPYEDADEEALLYVATSEPELFHTRKILNSAKEIPGTFDEKWHEEIEPPTKKGNKWIIYTWSEVNGVLAKWTITTKKGEVTKARWDSLAVGVGDAEMDWERGGPLAGQDEEINFDKPPQQTQDAYPSQTVAVNDSYVDVIWSETETTVQPVQVTITGFSASSEISISVVLLDYDLSTVDQTLNTTTVTTDGSGNYVWNYTAANDTYTGVGNIQVYQVDTPSKTASYYNTKSGSGCSGSACYFIIQKIAQRNSTNDLFKCRAYYFTASFNWVKTTADNYANDSSYACAYAYDIDISTWNFTTPDPDSSFQVFITDGTNTASAWFDPNSPHSAPQDIPPNAHSHAGTSGKFCTRTDLNSIVAGFGWQFESERIMQYDVIEHEFYHNVQYGANGWAGYNTDVEGMARNSESMAYPSESTWINGSLKSSTIDQHNDYLTITDYPLGSYSYSFALPWGFIYQTNGISVLRSLEYNLSSYSDPYTTGMPTILSSVLAATPGGHSSFGGVVGDLGVAIATRNLSWGNVSGGNVQNWSTYDNNVTKTNPTWSSDSATVSGTLYQWGTDFINASKTSYASILISFSGSSTTSYGISLVTRNSSGYNVQKMSLDGTNAGTLVFANPSSYSEGVLVIARNSSDGASTVSHTVTFTGSGLSHDISVSASAYEPSIVRTGNVTNITATIMNVGNNTETDIVVQLLQNGTQYTNTTIASLAAGASTIVSWNWSNNTAGTYNLTVYAVPVAEETSTSNNARSTNFIVTNNRIVLVDDDGGVSYQTYFATALTANNYTYVSWNTTSEGTPSNATLNQFQIVVWMTGQNYTSTLTSSEITAIQAYLDQNKSLFLSGQEVGYYLVEVGENPTFYASYLKATYIDDDSSTNTVVGVTGDPITDGMTLGLSGGDGASDNDYPDVINPNGSSNIFNYSGASTRGGGIRYNSSYQLVYLGFNFETVNAAADRTTLMREIIEWLDSVAPDNLSISINSGNASTTNSSVSLTLSASDITTIQCHYSNNGTNYTDYESYSATKSWNLTGENGNKIVYYQCRDVHGNVASAVNDSIILGAPPTDLTISINSGINYTNATNVTLTLYALNANECGYSNNGTNYTDWEAYNTTRNWNITSGDANKTVYYKCRATDNTTSDVANDWVVLDTTTPSNITFVSPTLANNSITSNNWSYVNITVTEANPSSCRLEWNNGSITNITMTRSGTNCYTNVTNQPIGVWNYSVYVVDSVNYTASNGTMFINITNPPSNVQFVSPTLSNGSYTNRSWIYINSTFNSTIPDSCWVVWNNGSATNISMTRDGTNCYKNITGQPDVIANYTVYVNDSSGNYVNSSRNYVTIDTTAPIIVTVSPTLSNNTNTSKTWVYINVTLTETNKDSCWVVWNNGSATNISMIRDGTNCYTNITGQPEGAWNYTIYANDSATNIGSNGTFYVAVDTTPPNITNASNQTTATALSFAAQFTANDTNGISNWALNNTNFTINSSGYISNASVLIAGVYWLNVSVNDSANNTASRVLWVNVTQSPTINSYSINPYLVANGSSVQIFINATNTTYVWANVTRPDGNSGILALTNNTNTTYTNTTLVGRYNVTFYANGTITEATVNSTDYFESAAQIIFNVSVIGANSSGINSSLECYYRDSELAASNANEGNFSEGLPTGLVELEFTAYSEHLIVRLRGVNVTNENNKTVGMDNTTVTGYVATYGVNTTINFTNATVYVSYNGTNYTNENYLNFYKCNNWSFSGGSCLGSWAEITDNATQNTTTRYFSYLTTNFSGFSVEQGLYCGDNTCNNGEVCSSCSADCGACFTGSSGSSGGGGGGGGGGGSGGSSNAKRNLTLEHLAAGQSACIDDSTCKDDEACIGSVCRQITGICGLGVNHTWSYYECCSDNMCAINKRCENHSCVNLTVVPVTNTTQKNTTCVDCNGKPPEEIDYIPVGLVVGIIIVIILLFFIKKPKKPKVKNKIAILLILLIGTVTANIYNHSLFSSSYIKGDENITTYKFKTINNYNTTTYPFRLWLSSNFTWFEPTNFEYALSPDGISGKKPYWDLPSLNPNESLEISFIVNGRVGLAENIKVETETIDKWIGECNSVKAIKGDYKNSTKIIKKFMDLLNRSQNITVYYEQNYTTGKKILAYLEGYDTFAVFKIGPNVSAISDKTIISTIVKEYIGIASPLNKTGVNITEAYEMIKKSKELKKQPEADCYRISGMDRFPCVDRDSCLYACFSVPVCSSIGQSGWSFMDTLQDYNKSITKVNQVFENTSSATEVFSKQPNYETAKAALDSMIELDRAETTVAYHPLFTSYGFCQPPEYGIPEQIGSRREVLDYLEMNCLHGEKGGIIDQSVKAAEFLIPPPPVILRPNVSVNLTVANITNSTGIVNQSNQTVKVFKTAIEYLKVKKEMGETYANLCWIIFLFVFLMCVVWVVTRPKN